MTFPYFQLKYLRLNIKINLKIRNFEHLKRNFYERLCKYISEKKVIAINVKFPLNSKHTLQITSELNCVVIYDITYASIPTVFE